MVTVDTDGDGVIDSIDLDSDNDGVLDSLECQSVDVALDFSTALTADTVPIDIDADGDGIFATIATTITLDGQLVNVTGDVRLAGNAADYTEISFANVPDGNAVGDFRLGAKGPGSAINYSVNDVGQVMTLNFDTPVNIQLSDALSIGGVFDVADQWKITSVGGVLTLVDPGTSDFEDDATNTYGTVPIVGVQGNGTNVISFIADETDGNWKITGKVTKLVIEMKTNNGSANLSPMNLIFPSCADTDGDGIPDYLGNPR